jgi:integrase
MRREKEKSRDRVLNDDEIEKFWRVLEDPEVVMHRQTRLVLKMILLTGQRPGEVAGMTWDEIEDDMWTIPETRAKNREPHSVPLCSMALDIIEQAGALSYNSEFVFWSPFKNGKPVTVSSVAYSLRRNRDKIKIQPHFTPHDLRRTLRTRLAELGISDIVAERVLGHKLQGVLAVYNRHHYDTEKRAALQAWEDKLIRILGLEPGEAKIIPMRKKSHA